MKKENCYLHDVFSVECVTRFALSYSVVLYESVPGI